jgi:signal transduction histidine kinase
MRSTSSDLSGSTEAEQHLARLEKELTETIHHERTLIAEELHDGLCQRLTTLSMLVATLHKHAEGIADPTCEGLLARIQVLTDQAIRETRALAHSLHPSSLGDDGLIDALGQLAENLDAAHHIACAFESGAHVVIPDGERAQHLYRIAQEATSNALRHGQPTHIALTLDLDDADHVVLTIDNDGAPVADGSYREGGLGLRSMRRRATRLGGTVSIQPRDGGGTSVRVTIPRLGVQAS